MWGQLYRVLEKKKVSYIFLLLGTFHVQVIFHFPSLKSYQNHEFNKITRNIEWTWVLTTSMVCEKKMWYQNQETSFFYGCCVAMNSTKSRSVYIIRIQLFCSWLIEIKKVKKLIVNNLYQDRKEGFINHRLISDMQTVSIEECVVKVETKQNKQLHDFCLQTLMGTMNFHRKVWLFG